jgi:putative FmdB family regulatory protein
LRSSGTEGTYQADEICGKLEAVPIYVYDCDQCNGRFEFTQKMSDPPMTVCESCGGKLQKIIVPIAFHLKGGGWYKDLYASQKSGGGGEAKGETKPEAKGESKTETKPETKTETKPSGSGGGGGGTAT